MVQIAWTLPSTWSSGAILTAAQLNTQLRDNLLAISGAWTSFTTTWSGTIGNGTKSAAYTRIGRTIHYRITVLWGSSTSHAAAPQTFTLPVAEAGAISSNGFPVGTAGSYDAGPNVPSGSGFAIISTGGTIAIVQGTGANYWSNLLPMTWATGDLLYVLGTYEASTD